MWKVLKVIFILILLIPVLLATGFGVLVYLFSGDFLASEEEMAFKRNLKAGMESGMTVFPLKDAVPFEWKEVCVGQEETKINGKRPPFFLFPENVWVIAFIRDNGEVTFFRMWEKDYYEIDMPFSRTGNTICSGNNMPNLILKNSCDHVKNSDKCFQLNRNEDAE